MVPMVTGDVATAILILTAMVCGLIAPKLVGATLAARSHALSIEWQQ